MELGTSRSLKELEGVEYQLGFPTMMVRILKTWSLRMPKVGKVVAFVLKAGLDLRSPIRSPAAWQ